MTSIDFDYNDISPPPWHMREMLAKSESGLSEYLIDMFETRFAIHPVEVEYNMFPEGLFATLLLREPAEGAHHYWAMIVSASLRSVGINTAVFVREIYDSQPTHTHGGACG